MVAEVCDRLAVPHEVLGVEVGGGASLQAQARAARYAALGAWAQRHDLAAVATAHHADDQAETLLMRLSRGSGTDGLAGIREQRPLAPGVTLVRPLLDWRKARLEKIVADAGLVPVADPANHDPRHDRTRVRALLRETEWLDPERLARSAAALAEAAAALDAMAVRERKEAAETDGGSLIYRPSELSEVRRRVTRLLIEEIHPEAEVRGPDLDRLLARLQRGDTATLAGVLVRPTSMGWHFSAAPPRRRLHP